LAGRLQVGGFERSELLPVTSDSKLQPCEDPMQGSLPISEYNVKCTKQAVIYNECSCDWPYFSLVNTNIQSSLPFPFPSLAPGEGAGRGGGGSGGAGPGQDLLGLFTSILRRTTV